MRHERLEYGRVWAQHSTGQLPAEIGLSMGRELDAILIDDPQGRRDPSRAAGAMAGRSSLADREEISRGWEPGRRAGRSRQHWGARPRRSPGRSTATAARASGTNDKAARRSPCSAGPAPAHAWRPSSSRPRTGATRTSAERAAPAALPVGLRQAHASVLPSPTERAPRTPRRLQVPAEGLTNTLEVRCTRGPSVRCRLSRVGVVADDRHAWRERVFQCPLVGVRCCSRWSCDGDGQHPGADGKREALHDDLSRRGRWSGGRSVLTKWQLRSRCQSPGSAGSRLVPICTPNPSASRTSSAQRGHADGVAEPDDFAVEHGRLDDGTDQCGELAGATVATGVRELPAEGVLRLPRHAGEHRHSEHPVVAVMTRRCLSARSRANWSRGNGLFRPSTRPAVSTRAADREKRSPAPRRRLRLPEPRPRW